MGRYKRVNRNSLLALSRDGINLNLTEKITFRSVIINKPIIANKLIKLAKAETPTSTTRTKLNTIVRLADLFPSISPFDHIIKPADS